ncbi:hypothetical protein AVEN_159253-1 [Araneus ventricosus]|uniref:Uncharacterized protein n=1 Tax=Araneus ventricosus TaxID=182803 RepID=A0A4Y2A0A6_ARAVE|nr:hypothetical protein AVEN_159253-1 [Araneus ventricosus]
MDDGDVSKETVLPLTSGIKKIPKCQREISNQHFQGSSLYSVRHLPHPSSDDNANNKTKNSLEQTGLSPTSKRPPQKPLPSTWQKTSGTSPS